MKRFVALLFFAVMTGLSGCSPQPGALELTPQTSSYSPESDNLIPRRQIVEIKSISKVDVLVVIDNSGSMATEQANMASRFDTFFDQLQGMDWRVAITTTDVRELALETTDGRLLEFPAMSGITILNSTMDINKAKLAFAETIQRNERGDGNEQAIAATYRAIERSLGARASGSDYQANFIRDDAALAVIAVTDADETPPTLGNEVPIPRLRNQPLNLLNLIQSTWNGAKNFSFHSIIVKEGDRECLAKDGNEKFGVTYATLSRLTHGIIGSVCESDYGSQLRIIANKVQDQVKTIHLDCVPAKGLRELQPNITFENSNSSLYPSYRLEDSDLIFVDNLPEGLTTVNYFCKDPYKL